MYNFIIYKAHDWDFPEMHILHLAISFSWLMADGEMGAINNKSK